MLCYIAYCNFFFFNSSNSTSEMETNRTSTSQIVQQRKVKNLYHSLAAPKFRVFSMYLIVLFTFSEGAFGDTAQKSTQNEKCGCEMIQDLAERIQTVEAMNEVLMRLALEENSTENEKCGCCDMIQDLAERIQTAEAMNEALIRLALGGNTTEPLPKGSGKIDWNLTDFSSRVGEPFFVRNESELTIEGPSFYTKGIGYKLGVSYHLDQESQWLIVYPLVGVYDKLLKWPMAGNISIAIVDQNEPSVKSKYWNFLTFDRKYMECANNWGRIFNDDQHSGCMYPMDVEDDSPIWRLVKNDSLHIRVEVEMTN